MNDVNITVLPLDCIDNGTSVAQLNISNRSSEAVKFDGDSFIFKGLYDRSGNLVAPNVLYDPIKEVKGKTYTIKPGEEKVLSIIFNDLQYFDLNDEEFVIEFEYSNLIRKSDQVLRGTIPIDRITAKVCK
ncbi:MAG TPA: hypothetical protein PKC30_12665 [Saprospiraceae bacterium]|nr:hypothetical protein [Saprospiraceae bacterium]